jgi:ADP-heptose:LPS heptosyltransferase
MGALGDMVMVTPLLKTLFERSGQKVDLVACGEWNRKLFAHCPWINTIHTVDSRNAPYWFNNSKRALVKQLKPNAAARPWFLFEHLPALHQLMYRANCQKSQAFLATDFPRQIGEHTCRQFLRIADAAFSPKHISTDPIATYLHCGAEDIRECETWLLEEKKIDYRVQKLVLIQAGNKKTMRKGKRDRASNIKYWPEQRWASLIDVIVSEEPDSKILLCGAPSEAN